MFRKMRKLTAMLMTVIMLVSMIPVDALAQIYATDVSSGIQPSQIAPMRVVQPDQEAYATYIFMVGGQEYARQIVKQGDTLFEPETPEDPEGATSSKFLGWRMESGSFFTDFGTVGEISQTAEITLTAAFERPYYVFFHDEEGRVVATKDGVEGDFITVADVSFDTGLDHGITGWYRNANFEGAPVSETVKLGTADIHLYAKVEQGNWLTFNSNGGTPVNAVFYLPGENTAEPVAPTRVGYAFAGWFTEMEEGELFSFGAAINEPTTVYAHWTPQQVSYTVIYWMENANDDGYTYHSSAKQTGLAGSLTQVSGLSNPPEGFTLKTNADGKPVDPSNKTVDTAIAGDGSTIVNVYYTRNVYQMNFWSKTRPPITCSKEEHQHSRYSCYDWWGNLICEKEEHTHTDNCYANVESKPINGTTWYLYERIEAKHGASIEWPGGTWHVNTSGNVQQSFAEIMPIGGDDFFWRTYGAEPGTVGSGDSASYYVEALNQNEDGDLTYNGTEYVRHHTDQAYSTDYSTTIEDFYGITGFTQDVILSKNNRYMGSYPDSVEGHTYDGAKFLYTRNSYDVNYIVSDGTTTREDSRSYRYQADITSAASFVPARPENVPANWTFDGWYADEAYTERYSFPQTMPAANLIVYGRWLPPTYTVTVVEDAVIHVEGETIIVPYNERLDYEEMPTYQMPEDYQWHGWATLENGVYTLWNFNNIVTSDMTLYPYYTSTASFAVTYDLNGGAGTAPIDDKEYLEDSYADVKAFSGTAPAGKVFLHWNTSKDGTGEAFYPRGKMQMPAANVTLYAIYGDRSAVTTLTYHANGGTGIGGGSDTKVVNVINNEKHTVLTVEAAGFERTGYAFTGWNTKADGTGTSFAADSDVRVNVEDEDENHLYAQWERVTAEYTIHHYLTGTQTMVADDTKGVANIGDTVAVNPVDEFLPEYAGKICVMKAVTPRRS